MSIVDRWITDFVMWRERAPAESDRVLDGVRALDLHMPTRVFITEGFIDEQHVGFVIPIEQPITIDDVHEALGVDALDTVLLADRRHVMFVDDAGHAKELPMNVLATNFYWQKCGIAGPLEDGPWVIRGDVLIVPDADYIEDEALRGRYE